MNRNLCLIQALIRDIENLIQDIVDIGVLGSLPFCLGPPVPVGWWRGGGLLPLCPHGVALVPIQVVHDASVHEGSSEEPAGVFVILTLEATFEIFELKTCEYMFDIVLLLSSLEQRRY